MPGDTTSVLDMHSDCNSGDTPFQYNIWIPLTNAFSTNSMFLLGEEESRSYYQAYLQILIPFLPPLEDAFVDIKFGSYLLFCTSLLHGNVLNTTSKTRVSVNIRVRSLLSPDLPLGPPDRKIGTYYKVWNTSSSTVGLNQFEHIS